MHGFRRDQAAFLARLDAAERAVLLDVVDGVVDLLGEVADVDEEDPFARMRLVEGEVEPPQDPALRRLLPDAYADPDLAAEQRRLTEAELRAGKVHRLRRLRAALAQAEPDVVVVASEAVAVAAALTDVRLVVAARLGLETDEQADDVYVLAAAPGPPADDDEATRRFLAAVYTVLTGLQESLVGLMAEDLPAEPG